MIVYLSEPHLATDLFVLTLFLSGVPVPPISVGGGGKMPRIRQWSSLGSVLRVSCTHIAIHTILSRDQMKITFRSKYLCIK